MSLQETPAQFNVKSHMTDYKQDRPLKSEYNKLLKDLEDEFDDERGTGFRNERTETRQ